MKLSHVAAAIAIMVVLTLAPHHASAAVDTFLQLQGHPDPSHVGGLGISQIISIMAAML
jgi:hypothetical protein